MALLIIAAIIIIVILMSYHCMPFVVQHVRIFKSSLQFPGPRAYPLIGNMHLFVGDNNKIWNKIVQLYGNYSSPYRIWFAQKLCICISEPDDLKTVLLHPHTIEKGYNYSVFKEWLGEGIFTAPAEKWRKHRKLIMATFNLKVLETFTSVFCKRALNVAEEMESEIGKEAFGILKYISNFSFGSICENAMGIDLGIRSGVKHPYTDASTRAFDILCKKAFKPWLQLDIIFNRTRDSSDLSKCVKYLHSVSDDVIEKKKLDFKSKESVKNSVAPRRTNFLTLLMELSNKGDAFTDRELRDEVNTMIIAGTDTISTTLCFVLLIVAMFPKVQDKIYQELYNIYGSSDPADVPVTYEDLQHFEYLDRVIKETLRIFPVGGVIFRTVMEDIKLGERVLTKGTVVMIGIYAVHHNEKYWPDSFKFDPDRFLPENVKDCHPYCYIPFSAGPRNCVGLKYADLAMKILLATLLRKVVFKQDKYKRLDEIQLELDVVLKAVDEITLQIERRT